MLPIGVEFAACNHLRARAETVRKRCGLGMVHSLCGLAIVVICFSAFSSADEGTDLASLLVSAESAYVCRDTLDRCYLSIELYEKALELASQPSEEHFTCIVRLSTLWEYVGAQFAANASERKLAYEECWQWAEKALESYPDDAQSHFKVAVAMGRLARERGILQSLSAIRPMRDHFMEAARLDPGHSQALTALSMLHGQAPPWPISVGNRRLAVEYAEKAYLTEPHDAAAVVQLARMRRKERRVDEALELLHQALLIPYDEMSRIDTLASQSEAYTLIEEWTR